MIATFASPPAASRAAADVRGASAVSAPPALGARIDRGQRPLAGVQGVRGGRLSGRLHGEHHVGRPGVERQPEPVQQLAVGGRPDPDLGVGHPVGLTQLRGDRHQLDRIDVAIADDAAVPVHQAAPAIGTACATRLGPSSSATIRVPS